MSVSSYIPRNDYVGGGNQNEYTFDFPIYSLAQLLVIVTDQNFNEVFRVPGTDVVNLYSVTIEGTSGGFVTLVNNLPTGYNLSLILANDQPTQQTTFRAQGDFTLKTFESALDTLCQEIQRVAYLSQKSIKLPEEILLALSQAFDTEIPLPLTPGYVIAINALGTGLQLTTNSSMLVIGNGLPNNASGANGQYYLNVATMILYGPYGGGLWPTPGTSLSGTQAANVVNITNGSQAVSVVYTVPLAVSAPPVISFINTVDATPIFLQGMVTAWSTTGFTVTLNTPTDTGNYQMSYQNLRPV